MKIDSEFLLGFDPMDEIHGEFVQVADELLLAPDSLIASALGKIADHLGMHFALEDGWMTETSFPPRQCHMDEHAAVLKSVVDVQQILQNDPEFGPLKARELANALLDWFPGHATHLDSALAHWSCKLRHGGMAANR